MARYQQTIRTTINSNTYIQGRIRGAHLKSCGDGKVMFVGFQNGDRITSKPMRLEKALSLWNELSSKQGV